jgi:hypothetical protein
MTHQPAKYGYIIVRTGTGGTTKNQCYEAKITIDGREVGLAGNHNLTGGTYRAVNKMAKERLGRGTYTLYNHLLGDIPHLIHEYSGTLLALKYGINLEVVGYLPHDYEELETSLGAECEEYLDPLVARGVITYTKNRNGSATYSITDEYKKSSRYGHTLLRSEVRKMVKAEQAKANERLLADKIVWLPTTN